MISANFRNKKQSNKTELYGLLIFNQSTSQSVNQSFYLFNKT